MVDRETLKQVARYRTNEQGQRIVEIPADLWDEWVSEESPTQKDRILAALREWDASAADLSDEWWNEFTTFLKENRLDLS